MALFYSLITSLRAMRFWINPCPEGMEGEFQAPSLNSQLCFDKSWQRSSTKFWHDRWVGDLPLLEQLKKNFQLVNGPSKGSLHSPQCSLIGSSIQIEEGSIVEESCLSFFVVNMDRKKP